MRFHGIGIEIHAQPRFIVDLNKSALDIGPVERQQLIHPAALSGNGFACHIVADRARPLASRPGMQLAPGIVIAYGQSEYLGHIGDAFRFKKATAVPEIRIQNIRSLIDDEILKALAAFQIFTRANRNARRGNQPFPGFRVIHRQRIFEP